MMTSIFSTLPISLMESIREDVTLLEFLLLMICCIRREFVFDTPLLKPNFMKNTFRKKVSYLLSIFLLPIQMFFPSESSILLVKIRKKIFMKPFEKTPFPPIQMVKISKISSRRPPPWGGLLRYLSKHLLDSAPPTFVHLLRPCIYTKIYQDLFKRIPQKTI